MNEELAVRSPEQIRADMDRIMAQAEALRQEILHAEAPRARLLPVGAADVE